MRRATTPGGSGSCRGRGARARTCAGSACGACRRRGSSRVFSGWNGQQMNAVKPPVSSCSSRSRSRCSTRSARAPRRSRTSSWRSSAAPARCATRITSSHSSVVHLSGAIWRRTSSSRISAPPPGIESSPAAISRVEHVASSDSSLDAGRCGGSPRARAVQAEAGRSPSSSGTGPRTSSMPQRRG